MLDGEVTIRAGERSISGWTQVRITRSIEQVPNTFEVGFTTERSGPGGTLLDEGSPVQVMIGESVVVTGYADVVRSTSDAGSHELVIAGRGKCQDLVDCAAEWPTAYIGSTSITDVARKLCQPYGIPVVPPPQPGPDLPFFDVTLIETPWTLIEEMARSCQVLVFEDQAGNLVFDNVGEDVAASGFTEGVNAKQITVTRSTSDRYSEYLGFAYSTRMLQDLGEDLNVRARAEDTGLPKRSDGQPRHRRRALVVEAPSGLDRGDVGARRVAWEQTRRAGRSRQALVTVEGWRDKAGQLWTPNYRAPLSLPSHDIDGVTWVIGDVTYIRDAEGTRTELLLMPAQAFATEPVQLGSAIGDILRELESGTTDDGEAAKG